MTNLIGGLLTDEQHAAQTELMRCRFYGLDAIDQHPGYNSPVVSLIDPDERYRNKDYKERFEREERYE